MTRLVALIAMAAALAGCSGNEAQRAQGQRTDAGHSYDVAQNPYVAPGWKAGDAASWEEHLRNRAKGQNEYTRIGR